MKQIKRLATIGTGLILGYIIIPKITNRVSENIASNRNSENPFESINLFEDISEEIL